MNVSVVTPTLNERTQLPECLSRLESQAREGDEVIVVDGGSDDGTQEVAKEMADRLLVAKNEDGSPSTIGTARHVGAMKAKNEIVVSTDADALPQDGWLEQIRMHFQNDEDLVVLWGSIQDINGVPIRSMVGKFSTIFRGASGNNTAFRKSAYVDMEGDYPDNNFLEDVAVINRLSSYGKTKRDDSLVMKMDMERDRYQTKPILGSSAVGLAAGSLVGGDMGNLVAGASVGLGGAELTAEKIAGELEQPKDDGHLHHDQVGMSVAGLGTMLDGNIGKLLSGIGAGIFAHHTVTEGVSLMPTELNRNTDVVIDK